MLRPEKIPTSSKEGGFSLVFARNILHFLTFNIISVDFRILFDMGVKKTCLTMSLGKGRNQGRHFLFRLGQSRG